MNDDPYRALLRCVNALDGWKYRAFAAATIERLVPLVEFCASPKTTNIFKREMEGLWHGATMANPADIARLPESAEDDSHSSAYFAMLALSSLARAIEGSGNMAARGHLCSIVLDVRGNLDALVDDQTVYPIVSREPLPMGSLEEFEMKTLGDTCYSLHQANDELGIRDRLRAARSGGGDALVAALLAARARGGIT